MLRPTPADGSYCTTRNAKTFDLDLLQSLALTISTRLSCIALASFNADDDILWLGVYEDGKLTTRYSSETKTFCRCRRVEDVRGVLCRIFEKPEKRQQVKKILRRPHGLLGLRSVFSRMRLSYLIEVLRHGDLAEALGLPWASVGLGYEYVNRGATRPDMKRETLRRTLSG